jgi:hypothetical protein
MVNGAVARGHADFTACCRFIAGIRQGAAAPLRQYRVKHMFDLHLLQLHAAPYDAANSLAKKALSP